MFIDSHHHLWQYNPGDYGWITDGTEVLRRDSLTAENVHGSMANTHVGRLRKTNLLRAR
jgi:predicted TIM-barrel fold metal-dependent hydrolase